jgi:hypothetical protein
MTNVKRMLKRPRSEEEAAAAKNSALRRKLGRALVAEGAGREEAARAEAAVSAPATPLPLPAASRIAMGTQGCIDSPPLPCAGGGAVSASASAVSKLQRAGLASQREREVLERLEAIDPGHSFHIRYLGSCAARAEDARGCWAAQGKAGEETAGELIVTERGVPLEEARLSSEERIAGLENLRRGLEAMAREGIVYSDLHAGNVVVGEDRLMRLIDFSDCRMTKDTAAARERNLFGLAALAQGDFVDDAAAVAWGEALLREIT